MNPELSLSSVSQLMRDDKRYGRKCSHGFSWAANDGSGDNHVFHLYVREKDPKAELWDGARSGTQAAVDVFNADEVSTT